MSIIERFLQHAKEARSAESGAAVARSANHPRAAAAPTRPEVRDEARFELDLSHLREEGLYPGESSLVFRQSEYRSIRRMVMAAVLGKGAEGAKPTEPFVVVSSSLPGEGKTFTTFNLALSIASEGTRPVILVDGDIFRRSLSRALGIDGVAGLTEALENPTIDPWTFVMQPNLPSLYVMPAGLLQARASDLVSSERVGALFRGLQAAFPNAIVLIDTPPLLLSSESSAICDAAGQVLLVVRAGVTMQDSVKQSVAKIRDNCPVGVVLNAWEPTLLSEKKYYGVEYR